MGSKLNRSLSDAEEEEKNASQEYDLQVTGNRGTRDSSLIKKPQTRKSDGDAHIGKLQSSGIANKKTL